jgi:hypothetical protein
LFFWPKWDRVSNRRLDVSDYQSDVVSICVSYSGETRFASRNLAYRPDGGDFCSGEAMPRYNGTVDFATGDKRHPNALFKGRDSVSVDFAPTRFMDDGITDNYIVEAIDTPMSYIVANVFIVMVLMNIISSIDLSPEATAIAIGVALFGALIGSFVAIQIFKGQYTEQILTSGDNFSTARLLIPNKIAYDNMVALNYNQDQLVPNLLYNKNGETYDQIYKLDTPVANRNLPNYPMFFEPNFKGNLYDNFWQQSDSRFRKINYSEFSLNFNACCDLKSKLGLYNGQMVMIDDAIKVQFNNIEHDLVISKISCNFAQNTLTITASGV